MINDYLREDYVTTGSYNFYIREDYVTTGSYNFYIERRMVRMMNGNKG